MKKTILATTVFAALSAPAMAMEPWELYGTANISIGQNSADSYTDADGNKVGSEDEMRVESHTSKFGLKGGVEISEALAAIYKLEFGIDTTNGSKDNIKGRNQYAGLKGDFGQLVIGRNDTAFKTAKGKIDLFSDYEGDMKHTFKGNQRADQTLTYDLPKLSGFFGKATYVAEQDEDQDGENGFALNIGYGDKKLKKTSFYLAAAYQDKIAGYDGWRLAAAGSLYNFKLGAIYQQLEDQDNIDRDSWLLSAGYSAGNWFPKIQYSVQEVDGDDYNDVFSVGVDYKLHKKTKLFAYWTGNDFDSKGKSDLSTIALGIKHSF